MKKYQKLYQLKQIVNAYAEYSKYARLTRKLSHPKEYDEKLIIARVKFNELSKDIPALKFWDGRLLNIAYTMLKGKKYFQIERSVRKGNELKDYQWKKIIDIMVAFKDVENEVVIPTSPFPITLVNEPKKVEVSNE